MSVEHIVIEPIDGDWVLKMEGLRISLPPDTMFEFKDLDETAVVKDNEFNVRPA